MEEIILQQRNSAKPVSGKSFILGIAGVVVRLALAQIVVNLLIAATGVGLLNIAFYLYAVVTLIHFMTRTVAGSVYTLKSSTLTLQKMLGDSTISLVSIPLNAIVGVRPAVLGDRLKSSYRSETVLDAAAAAPWRIHLAYGLSVFSARLARRTAGDLIGRERGYVVAYEEGGKRQACVFCPDEAFCQALASALPQAYGLDERTRENTPVTLLAQALQRAFPQLYPFVQPLVTAERAESAAQEIAAQKAAREAKKAGGAKAEEKNSEEVGHEVQDDTL